MVAHYIALQHRTKALRKEINGVPQDLYSLKKKKNPQRNKLEASEPQNHGKLWGVERKIIGIV